MAVESPPLNGAGGGALVGADVGLPLRERLRARYPRAPASRSRFPGRLEESSESGVPAAMSPSRTRTVLVTGGAGLVGSAVTRALLRQGAHVVVLDDILDSGQTLATVKGLLEAQNPASLRMGVMLDKKTKRTVDVHVDYVGFEIPDEFVVGYGLDFNGYYRNYPEIAVLKPELIPSR